MVKTEARDVKAERGFSKAFTAVILIAISFLFVDCANQLPPGGGDIDRIPPEIVSVYPANETTNYGERYFQLEFSEWVDKRTLREAIFISPAVEGELELNWSGRSVRVYFPDQLRENTTYVVTIGTDVVDLNNRNRMADAFTFIFSTGDEIHRKMITGKVYAEKADDVMIFVYDTRGGEINPFEKKPDFISQAGASGNYRVMGLDRGSYRVFAVKDEFRDLLLQPEQDLFGAPFMDVVLGEEDTLFSNLDFFLASADTVPPRLMSATMTDRHHLLLNLSKEFDSLIIRNDNFYLFDSTANRRVEVVYAFKGNTRVAEMVVVIRDNIPVTNNVYVFADTLRDRRGNVYRDDFLPVTVSDRADTTRPGIWRVLPQLRSDNIDFVNSRFRFFFDDAFDTSRARGGVSFTDTARNNIDFNITFFDDASFEVRTTGRLEASKNYLININLNMFQDAAGNRYDSTYIYPFRTISGLDFTGLSGTITGVERGENLVLLLEGVGQQRGIYRTRVNERVGFSFERVEPGQYRLWGFIDRNGDGDYNFGYPFPFEASEEFSFYPDTLNLRARWVQSDLNFRFR
jgi:hypothetical protein